jgi:hypothetical protein
MREREGCRTATAVKVVVFVFAVRTRIEPALVNTVSHNTYIHATHHDVVCM